MWAICADSRMEVSSRDIDQFLLHGDLFSVFFSQYIQSSEVWGKHISIRNKLPTATCWSREKVASLFKALCQCGESKKRAGNEWGLFSPGSRSPLIPLVALSLFRSSSLTESLEQAREKGEEGVNPQANYSQYSSPVEALNLIVESKSLPIEINNSTIELQMPVEVKVKLSIIFFYGFWFPCFQVRFDMTFDDMLRDGSSVGKLTNSCY